MPSINLSQVFSIATDSFISFLPKDRELLWDDIVHVASYYGQQGLGIHQSAWAEACTTMGRVKAALCVIIADKRTQMHQVTSAGGFLRGCSNKAKQGELHLEKSIYGLMKNA